MARAAFLSADEAVALIRDSDTVAVVGGGGGLLEASALFAAVERRFLDGAVPTTFRSSTPSASAIATPWASIASLTRA